MSEHERPDAAAFRELGTMVRRLVEELSGFRKRALSAEAKLKGYEAAAGHGPKAAGARLAKLEEENARLRAQVEKAKSTTKSMLERVHFLRQQAQAGEK